MQFVELRMLAPGQQFLSDGGGSRGAADLIFDEAGGTAETRRVFTFTHDLGQGSQGARILLGTSQFAVFSGLTPDFVLPAGMLAPRAGRVCYRVNPPQAASQPTGIIDCVAYGQFTGENGSFGAPTPITPDNRALQRVALSGRNADDWSGALRPTPTNNQAVGVVLETLCGDGLVSQGEECDGEALAGKTCASIGFASGTLGCAQCHLDTSECSFCGNGAINPREECDGADLGGRSCAALGFTGGSLSCNERCRLSTKSCDPTFFVPGGGPRGPECLAEWRVTNSTGRPGLDGKAPVRQRCKDGDGGCDTDAAVGTCTFSVALCFEREDARLAMGGKPCRRAPIESWTLLKPPLAEAPPLLPAAALLGPSSTAGNVVSFAPPLAMSEQCTDAVAVPVPLRGRRPGTRVLRARTTGAGGKPRDVDALKLVCTP